MQTCGDHGEKVCIGFNHPVRCKLDEWKSWLGGTSGRAKLRTMLDCWNCQNGATFTGNTDAMLRYVEAANKTLTEYHTQKVVDCDQGIQMQLFMNTGTVQDVECKGFKFCSGFMLGAWKRADKDKMMWHDSDCDDKDSVDNVKLARKRSEESGYKSRYELTQGRRLLL